MCVSMCAFWCRKHVLVWWQASHCACCVHQQPWLYANSCWFCISVCICVCMFVCANLTSSETSFSSVHSHAFVCSLYIFFCKHRCIRGRQMFLLCWSLTSLHHPYTLAHTCENHDCDSPNSPWCQHRKRSLWLQNRWSLKNFANSICLFYISMFTPFQCSQSGNGTIPSTLHCHWNSG